jgi:hypothetical protein
MWRRLKPKLAPPNSTRKPSYFFRSFETEPSYSSRELQVALTTCYSFAPGLIHLRTISEKKAKFAVYVFHKKTGTNSTEKR